MHHLYPSLKGDPLCPLGFHPQTRYPTRCKRCFRDYKEHGSRRGLEDIAASSPNLSDAMNARNSTRSWTSTQNLSESFKNDIELKKRPQSWASTPDIDAADDQTTPNTRSTAQENNVDVTVKLPIPSRRHTTTLDLKEVENSLSQNATAASSSASSSTKSSPSRTIPDDLVIRSTDSLAERARKMNLLKKQRSLNSRESSRERSIPRSNEEETPSLTVKAVPVKPLPAAVKIPDAHKLPPSGSEANKAMLPPRKVPASISLSKDAIRESAPKSVASTSTSTSMTINKKTPLTPISEKSSIQRREPEIAHKTSVAHDSLTLRKKVVDMGSSTAQTPSNEQKAAGEEIKRLQFELEGMKTRAERAERDKSDILLRRLASMDTTSNRTAASEALKLQQSVNELKAQLDKVNEEKRRLNTRMKALENNPKGDEYDLKRKLQAAEQLCEELMEENQQAKKEIIGLQAEMDELQDTFRDDDMKAKTNLQKDLEKTTKNCRILSFKLKKCERKIETLESEKQGGGKSEELVIKVKKLEEELKFANELTRKLQVEAEELRNPGKKKAPMLGSLGKSTSADAKFTRESLTRGGSQEDPQQLWRDLQDSIERESDLKDQLKFSEEEAENLRKKVARFEDENDSLMLQLKKMATRSRTRKFGRNELQADRDEGISDDDDPAELRVLLELNEQEASILRTKVEELERENGEVKKTLRGMQEKMREDAHNDRLKPTIISKLDAQKLKKAEDENKKLMGQLKDFEEKIKKNEQQMKLLETSKSSLELKMKRELESLTTLKSDYDKEKKDREAIKAKYIHLESELANTQKSAENIKSNLEKEIKDLKSKSATTKTNSKQVLDLKKQITDLENTLSEENDRYKDLRLLWEKLSEETILMRAQLTTEKDQLQTQLSNMREKLSQTESWRSEKSEFERKLSNAQKQIQELEAKSNKSRAADYEKSLLKNKLAEKEQEYDRLRRENEMNIDLVFQLRKDNDDLGQKLSDFSRIEQAQSSIYNHNAQYDNDMRALKIKLENAELQLKSDVAATRLRYEQQVKNLGSELTAMQRQCEKFKKDRDAFKQLLESAQKKIGEMKGNATGRQSRSSMHSSDEDDKSKIAYLEQQIGHLEDQLVESRLEVSKVKTDLVSERSANEIKISEMQSKLNEFEEERVIGSGRTKIPGMKTKLELSWQKEREDQQRLLQETSTLARDLRQTLFEVERERDKERLESKRRLDQLKRSTEEELEEGRKKIAELQCDLLELRDVHAKLRTSNEKLRRERERYEKELIRRRMEQEGGEKKISALLHTVDELVKIAPDLKTMSAGAHTASAAGTSANSLRAPMDSMRRSRSPSPNRAASGALVLNAVNRLAEASEELRKFQSTYEDDHDRIRVRRSNLRRAASQENDPHGSTNSVASSGSLSRSGSGKLSRSNNGSIRKSLSLDHSIQKDQNIWRQDEDSASSMQSINSEFGGMGSTYDSRLSGDSTQSDITRGPRKKKKGLMGKLRSLTKSGRNSGSELSMQGSDSDLSVASSDVRSSKKDLRGRLSGMFKRSGSTSRNNSMEHLTQRPVAVTVVGDADGPQPREPPPPDTATPKSIRSVKPPTPTQTTPLSKRRVTKKV